MDDLQALGEALVPATGRLLTLPEGPIFHLQRAGEASYEIGEFRAWAGYKNLGSDTATADLAHFQHVLSFGATEAAGRTGVHAHLAYAHIVIPTSGRGVFAYDGVVTEAAPGSVIVQHGGTIHDQFDYSYAGGSYDDNCATPLSLEPAAGGGPVRSFGFLELFVPKLFANVEIIPPAAVTDADQRTAWDHPYHSKGADFAIQTADAPDAAYRPLAGAPGLEARDCGTWAPSAEMVATWIVRPLSEASVGVAEAEIAGEAGGVDIFFVVAGSLSLAGAGKLEAGDTLTCGQGAAGTITGFSPDLSLLKIFIAAKTQGLRQYTRDEIARVEALGPSIITGRQVRPEGDPRPVNFLRRF